MVLFLVAHGGFVLISWWQVRDWWFYFWWPVSETVSGVFIVRGDLETVFVWWLVLGDKCDGVWWFYDGWQV